jgi:Teichoic acid biosynthesis proteins
MAKKDERLIRLINSANHVIPDGIGLIYGAKLKKINLKERVTGYDTSIKLLEIANKHGLGLYLLGGKDGVSKEAFDNILKNIQILDCVDITMAILAVHIQEMKIHQRKKK